MEGWDKVMRIFKVLKNTSEIVDLAEWNTHIIFLYLNDEFPYIANYMLHLKTYNSFLPW